MNQSYHAKLAFYHNWMELLICFAIVAGILIAYACLKSTKFCVSCCLLGLLSIPILLTVPLPFIFGMNLLRPSTLLVIELFSFIASIMILAKNSRLLKEIDDYRSLCLFMLAIVAGIISAVMLLHSGMIFYAGDPSARP